ncbi:phage holin family protein [Mycolicibacterium sediminis]|uniref:Membrane protein n=2 Tax=Mycolicibacterium sediminis TaxID=1286180 RepID=A0A7I7QNV1_9MYCO|nr:membrane protein [Mycolicibacterium sediminis]
MGELLGRLSAQTSRLVRDEIRLAQREFQDSAKHAAFGAGLGGAAGVLALFGFGAVIAAGIAALALVLPVWAAALIVAAVLFVVAGIAGALAKKQVDEVAPVAPRTAETVKDDVREVNDARHA